MSATAAGRRFPTARQRPRRRREDPSIYGFCYESCRTDRAAGSCGKPAPGETRPPQRLCDPIEDTATLRAIIGPPLGTGASPFVDDNTGPDGAQPAGYTFLGQFIDHDVTRTTTALSALGALDRAVQSDPSVQTRLAAAGITPGLLHRAVVDAAAPGSALSANTGKLDLDSVYGVPDFATLAGIGAPWFEQQNGAYTGRFAMREVAAPSSGAAGVIIDGFDYERSSAGAAEIPDPRNSEHKMLSQLQNLFELAHNDCMDHGLAGAAAPSQQQIGGAFDDCHKKVLWTYETIVATDFLPRISAEATLERVAPGALHAYVRGTTPTSMLPAPSGVHTFLYGCTPGVGDNAVIRIPHEFAVAAFRLGHSLVRDDYVLHDVVRDADGNILTGQPRPIFAAAGQAADGRACRRQSVAAGRRDRLELFLRFRRCDRAGDPAARHLDLRHAVLAAGGSASSGAGRGRQRHPLRAQPAAPQPLPRVRAEFGVTGSVGLATGEEAERYAQRRIAGLHDATAEVKSLLAARLKSAGFKPDALGALTPLWLFVLAEAETTQASRRLGELGSHIVDEFLLGSLYCDMGSVLYAPPADLQGWGPTAAIVQNRRYSMPELIAYLQANAIVGGRSIRLYGR